MGELVLPLESVGRNDVPRVGGKNASLGEMIQALAAEGIRVPPGFATTAEAYRAFLRENGLEGRIRSALGAFHAGKASLRQTGGCIRSLILEGHFSEELQAALHGAYRSLCKQAGQRMA